MSAKLTKDASIWLFLGDLAKRFDAHEMEVVDLWDADLFAIGVARTGASGRLVYVSTFRQVAHHFAYECEEPSAEEEYRVTDRAEGVTLDQLIEVIRHHLSLPENITEH